MEKTGYETESQRKTSTYLLVDVERGDDTLQGIPKTPNSLRDAEQIHNVYFYEKPLDDSEDYSFDDTENVDVTLEDQK